VYLQSREADLAAHCPRDSLENVFDHFKVHFPGLVVKRVAACVQFKNMRDIALVALPVQFLLLGRSLNIEIDDDEVHPRKGGYINETFIEAYKVKSCFSPAHTCSIKAVSWSRERAL
jgi:hypothetical protein